MKVRTLAFRCQSDGHEMVLTLMACALIASGVSRLISVPLYASLAELQRLRVTPSSSQS